MVGEIGRPARRAMRLEIGRRGADHHPARREPPRHQAGVLQRADPDREVPAFLDQVNQPVVQPELDADTGIQRGKAGEQRRDLTRAERQRDVQPQQSARLDAVGRDRALGRLEIAEHAFGEVEIAPPRLGDGQPPRGAVKQLGAEPRFERCEVLGDHGRRHAEQPCRSGQAAGSGHLREDFQPCQPVKQSAISLWWCELNFHRTGLSPNGK